MWTLHITQRVPAKLLSKGILADGRQVRKHTKEFAIKEWKEKGYPSHIDWETLGDRSLQRGILISSIIAGANCHFRRRYQRVVVTKADRFVNIAENLPVPGYYGMKGFETMSDKVMEEFADEFRLMMPDDPLMGVRGVTTFSHYVVLQTRPKGQ